MVELRAQAEVKAETKAEDKARKKDEKAEEKRNEEARAYIAEIIESQRGARGGAEGVSVPRGRRLGRRAHLLGSRIAEVVGGAWRRLGDSHRFPGRIVSRLRLYRPRETITGWVLAWIVAIAGCAYALFVESADGALGWLAGWGLGGAVAALVAVMWHDAFKSPHTARRVRHRITAEPELLLRPTLAEPAAKIVELEPPVNTVPRDDLYDELLPGILNPAKDVQIVVGAPGAGKTTALLDLASVLARIGLVPVMLELRGERNAEDLFEVAKLRFETQVRPLVKTSGDADIVWRWLCRRQRVVLLVDDIDQIGFDGEPGFLMRSLLENVAREGQAVVVTARPAGVPVGIAASAINLEPLEFETAVELVAQPVAREPGAVTAEPPPRARVERWIRGGELNEVPLYLEALAELTSVGVCPDLPQDPRHWGKRERDGRWRSLSARRREWVPLWVRYMLLDRFRTYVIEGDVRRSVAIDRHDRERSVKALEGAALGLLGATGLAARAAADRDGEPGRSPARPPKRTRLVDFIGTNDRGSFASERVDSKLVQRREGVSQHEAVDTGERLRIIEPDSKGEPQFRHRIMQAFFAGRRLAEIGREESEAGGGGPDGDDGHLDSFDDWVEVLMDHHHSEKLTAHLALTFAALYADDCSLRPDGEPWRGLAKRIASALVEEAGAKGNGGVAAGASQVALPARAVAERLVAKAGTVVIEGGDGAGAGGNGDGGLGRQLDPMVSPDPHERRNPDDQLIKLSTAANIVALIKPTGAAGGSRREEDEDVRPLIKGIVAQVGAQDGPMLGAMRWTKLQALPAIAGLDDEGTWRLVWEQFTRDLDYDVRRAASRQLERNARYAYPQLMDLIDKKILWAGFHASRGESIQETDGDGAGGGQDDPRTFIALGWVLPAIVSGLGEELRFESGFEAKKTEEARAGGDARAAESGQGDAADRFRRSRLQLEEFAALAYSGGRHELEESLAQGFKADAMRHAADPGRRFSGAGWVAGHRRLVADVCLPHAESWYARMLLYQSLALYAVSGASRHDSHETLAYRLGPTRERHPLAREAAKLSQAAMRRAELRRDRWQAFIWSDEVEDGGRLPAVLARRTAQLVGDVALLVDLKEGSPSDRHRNFGHMEELPYCLSGSPDRHEILGTGCPQKCGWGFCPYRATSPDEPNEHRGLGRGFCRGERRSVRRVPWQGSISKRRLREFWQQMEYKARR